MASEPAASESPDTIEVDLKNRHLAAVLAWLWPGAGHMYQGRYGKGTVFMICILVTFFFGLVLGNGHVVYASLNGPNPGERGLKYARWQYVPQFFVGAPALPALLQWQRVDNGDEPLWNGLMAPPADFGPQDDLSEWHFELGNAFELGTLYTVIAGLLNVLAIYDAYAGPFVAVNETEETSSKKKKRKGEGDESEDDTPAEKPEE